MASKEYKPEITEEKLGFNPFVAALKIPVHTAISKGLYHAEDGILEPQEIEYDSTPSAKIYISSERRKITAGLSYRPLQLWHWVLQTIEAGHDYIWINRARAMDECRMKSVRTFADAIKELCRYGFLSPCVNIKGVYFINPEMGFRGSRVKKYPENLVYKNKES
jgi:hypothetical protein